MATHDHKKQELQVIERAREEVRGKLTKMETQFASLLPSHIPVDRFVNTVMTATRIEPKLLSCDRKSFFNACVRCAQDGLLPDGHQACLVAFKMREDGSLRVSYIPMIAGIRIKVRQSKEISSWNARLVHECDEFDFAFGLKQFVIHRPLQSDRGPIIATYSIARFFEPNAEPDFDVMFIDEVEAIRKKSRAQNGPWNDVPVGYGEMVKKTMLKRHAKALPLSADLDTLIRRDDEIYDLTPVTAPIPAPQARPKLSEGRRRPTLQDFANAPSASGGAEEDNEFPEGSSHPSGDELSPDTTAQESGDSDQLKAAYDEGYEAWYAGKPSRPLPPKYRRSENKHSAAKFLEGFAAAKEAEGDNAETV